jgi:hypothetical protein
MREQEITAIGQDLDGFAILRRRRQPNGWPLVASNAAGIQTEQQSKQQRR